MPRKSKQQELIEQLQSQNRLLIEALNQKGLVEPKVIPEPAAPPPSEAAQIAQALRELVANPQKTVISTGPVVGVRNVSNYTIGFKDSPTPNEPELQLAADFEGNGRDPSCVAVISHAWWKVLRKHPVMRKGMLIRDDSVLGPHDVAAPPDGEHEIPAQHAVNLVLDPRAFIEDQPELDLRHAISQMTSEESLRRLLAAVDQKVRDAQAEYPEDDHERASKAVADLPSIYQLVETLVRQRLDKIAPAERV